MSCGRAACCVRAWGCHGISGNGFLFLYLFRATRSAKYLHRAWAFARFSLSDECAREAWNKPDEVRRCAVCLRV
jgi:hypothetical protein